MLGRLWCRGIAFWLALSLLRPTGAADAPNWIVVTTDREEANPTLQKLSVLSGWQLLVVATGNISSAHWNLEGALYLDKSNLSSMKTHIGPHIPPGSQGLRMLGYLYAIRNGADVILDMDDMSPPLRAGVPTLPSPSVLSVYETDQQALAINVLRTFGVKNTWPLGFPLESVHVEPPSVFRRSGMRPLIQHGVGDVLHAADVFTLLTTSSAAGEAVNQNSDAIALPKGTFCPFPLDRTLYMYDALWALVLPISLAPPLAQVWRSYIAQRLLWDIGGQLAFVPPPAPMAHPPLSAAREAEAAEAAAAVTAEEATEKLTPAELDAELDFHTGISAMLRRMADMQLGGNSIDVHLQRLVALLVEHKWLGAADAEVVDLWIKDLKDADYRWPKLGRVREVPMTRPEVKDPTGGVELFPRRYPRINNMVLIVMYNHPVAAYVVRVLDQMYRPVFGKVVHTGYMAMAEHGPRDLEGITFEDCHQSRNKHGWFMQECFGRVMHAYEAPADGGYLIIADDTVIDPCRLPSLPPDRVWSWAQRLVAYPAGGLDKGWNWHKVYDGERTLEEAMKRAAHALRDTSQILSFNASQMYLLEGKDGLGRHWSTTIADFLYVPHHMRAEFIALSMHFTRERVHAEVAMAHIVGILTNSSSDKLHVVGGHSLWNETHNNRTKWKLGPAGLLENKMYVHGIKFSQFGWDIAEWWTELQCSLVPGGLKSLGSQGS